MRILLTADPAIAVPPQGYGGIERIVDALVRHYRTQNHTIGLVAHRDSRSPANEHFPWPGRSSTSLRDTLRNTLALRRAVRVFRPDVLHSFSRLAYLSPLLLTRLPKVMSYQRHTGGPQIALATCLGGRSLHSELAEEEIAEAESRQDEERRRAAAEAAYRDRRAALPRESAWSRLRRAVFGRSDG